MTGRVVHFEVPYDDAGRAREFYSGLFGWKLEERFGYVRGFQHAYSTRLGFLFSL